MDQPFIGTIVLFAGNFAPKNWALCQGQIMAISQNTALFSILGTTYGGNGQTNFALPNLQSRSPIGAGQGPGLSQIVLGEMAGVENTTILTSNLPPHNHLILCNGTSASQSSPVNNFPGSQGRAGANVYSDGHGSIMNPLATSVTGSGIPFSNRPPFLGLNYIICLYGVFPSRN
ncbi:MAG TPA: tail fiber protein [Verrucomicrobiae bacterium]|nr:tail fiber protein [Verrucomicrobiae bacterium]